MNSVVLKPGREKAVRNRHHWIFSGAVRDLPDFEDGAVLPVRSSGGDLLGHVNGEDFRPNPLLDRKRRLSKLLSKDPAGLRYVEHLAGDGPTIFEHACMIGLEGIVSKLADSSYKPGPSKAWQKTKNREHPAMQRVRETFERKRASVR